MNDEIRTPIYVFDVDGTVTLPGDRKKFLEGEKKNWDEFYDACDKDEPNLEIIQLMNTLIRTGATILLLTARPERTREKTLTWMQNQTEFVGSDIREATTRLFMRKDRDWRQDHDFKKAWYESLDIDVRSRIVCFFDDRDRVVSMWRSLGLTCMQVAEGNF